VERTGAALSAGMVETSEKQEVDNKAAEENDNINIIKNAGFLGCFILKKYLLYDLIN
jgi:hypothetical protein